MIATSTEGVHVFPMQAAGWCLNCPISHVPRTLWQSLASRPTLATAARPGDFT